MKLIYISKSILFFLKIKNTIIKYKWTVTLNDVIIDYTGIYIITA